MNEIQGNKPAPIQAKRMLIGEGVEEVLFFEAFLSHLGISGVQLDCYNGRSALSGYLRALKLRSGFLNLEKLGIVRDADEDSAAAFASVDSAITRAEFEKSLNIKTLIIPGRNKTGALESLCLASIAGQPIEACVENYLKCASQVTGKPHATITNKAKARVRVWLACHEEPLLRLGLAAKRGLLDWNCPAFDEVKAFLMDLA